MKKVFSFRRGFLAQFFAITVLPLTLLLLLIAFGSVEMHQQDMRALVSRRDERSVQSASAALESELHHRMASISSLAAFAETSGNLIFDKMLATNNDLLTDFDGGVAFIDANGQLIATTTQDTVWNSLIQNRDGIIFATAADQGPVISNPFVDSISKQTFVIVSAYSSSIDVITAGAFSPASLARQTLSTSYPSDSEATIYLLDGSGKTLYVSGTSEAQNLPAEHPGVAEALRGESGTKYVQVGKSEHVIAYSPVPLTGWALITEEDWEAVVSPSLQTTQLAPLVLVPAFILALVALWFAVRQIVQPLQKLEAKAAALAWGDFAAIQEPVGGISEVQHLQLELTEMANKVQAAQEGLHDYIGAITAAQEEERTRLARELHDDTIQAVIALKQRVQLAQKSVKDQTGRQSLKELENLAEQTVENLRRLTRALRPIYLEDLGLVTALEMLTREISQSNNIDVEFQRSGEERRLPRDVELALYRIAQEALSNIVRHAKAKHAVVSIHFDEEIKLEVRDNGVGFSVPKSPTDFAHSGHFGLLGMQERAELIGGRLEVQSEPREGTSLSVSLKDTSRM